MVNAQKLLKGHYVPWVSHSILLMDNDRIILTHEDYPSLLDATIDTLSEGLACKRFTSHDLVTVCDLSLKNRKSTSLCFLISVNLLLLIVSRRKDSFTNFQSRPTYIEYLKSTICSML